MTMWNWSSDYSRAYAETDDPRLLLVIERDEDAQDPEVFRPETEAGT